jgi:hypothetical protein
VYKLRYAKLLFIALIMLSVISMSAAVNRNSRTHLSGDEEVPVRMTNAQGQAIFHLSKDGTELNYKLIVANIENVVQAHIHLGQPGVNGNIVVFLYGLVAPGGGRTNGVLAEGTITSDDLINDLAGQSLSALLDQMAAGNAYVNVHTNDGVAPPNTGPGDFPGGEIRGQID